MLRRLSGLSLWGIRRSDGATWPRTFRSEAVARRYARRFLRGVEIEFRELTGAPPDDVPSRITVMREPPTFERV